VQIDTGPRATIRARRFAALWKKVMVSLNGRSRATCFLRVELGPPCYAILDREGREISDRWAQSLVIRTLAERLFNEAVKETGAGRPHRGAAAP
jgi:hypothetical protein